MVVVIVSDGRYSDMNGLVVLFDRNSSVDSVLRLIYSWLSSLKLVLGCVCSMCI